MNKKQRNRALKRKHYKINATELNPRQAAGLTQGADEHGELLEYGGSTMLPGESTKAPGGLKAMQHLNDSPTLNRVPRPHFVAREHDTGLVREDVYGRRFMDAELVFPKEVVDAMRQGMICLKCLEPQPHAWADAHVPGCEGVLVRGSNYMKDWQIIDLAMEFEGETHVGPSKPMAEYEAEIEDKRLKREFAEKIAAGKSKGRRARAS